MRTDHVGTVIVERSSNRIPDRFQAREMDHRLAIMLFQDLGDTGRIAYICFIGRQFVICQPPHPVQRGRAAIDKIVDDNGRIAAGKQLDTRVRADIARPSCDQYLLNVDILADDSGRFNVNSTESCISFPM